MFCPKCSQQQLSDQVRFCSRCGLPLASVTALLAGREGAAEGGGVLYSGERAVRQAGIRRGAKMMFFSLFLAPIFLGFSFLADTPVPLFVPIAVFLAGLAILLYAAVFGEELLAVRGLKSGTELGEGRGRPPLAAPLFSPAAGLNPHQVNTSEIRKPLSVTESTTKLLDKE